MIDFVSCHASETLVLNMGELKYSTVFRILELLQIVTVEMSQQFFELVPNCSESNCEHVLYQKKKKNNVVVKQRKD